MVKGSRSCRQSHSTALSGKSPSARGGRSGRRPEPRQGAKPPETPVASRAGVKRVPAAGALPRTPPGGKPPETPKIVLDTDRPSHGSRDYKGAVFAKRVPRQLQEC